ncbi:MAG TPA: glycosyltransferase family 9 protein [Ignavibacteriaceae bacterium]|nr:glycosyltransferase family 9 protein [Ignavibacteriaceae bacterium]
MVKLNNVKNLLIIRLSSLGDILLATPLIRSIKKQFPAINIDFIAREQYRDALKFSPHIRNLYELSENYDELKEQVAESKYDLIIDLQNNVRSRKLTSEAKTKITRFKKHDLEKFLLVKFKINKLKELPQIPVRYSNTLDNFSLDENGLEISVPDNFKSSLKEEGNYIGLAPGSRHFTKMWPSYYYIYLCKMLLVNDFNVVLFGGKNDKDICKEIAGLLPKIINLCNDDDILQTVTDMKMCRAVVCNDSGMMHTACAAGVPVLPIFGSTVKEFGFTPYKTKNLILENNSLSCRPCSHIGRSKCPKEHFKCMLDLTPQLVFRNINFLLNSQ